MKITQLKFDENQINALAEESLSGIVSENESSKSVLELTHDEALKYFLKHESYCSFEIPEYFNFDKLLLAVDITLRGKSLKEIRSSNPRKWEGINYKIFINKDGKYAWRPLQLINPALYVSLVHNITYSGNWKKIQTRFKKFSAIKNIECLGIPRQSLTSNSDKAEQISNWWHQIEQRSIEMALDYPCVTHTDLTDCYGSIYTHSVAWALHGKEFAKDPNNRPNKEPDLIGNAIDIHLQDMSDGQTNGIPQGSTLMDFIAEMVLGFADLELSIKLKENKIKNYNILRFRDDYRIFSQSSIENNKIIKLLSEVMIGLGFKLSAEKTIATSNVIQSAIKSDKLFWMQQNQTDKNLHKSLLIIHALSVQFPNSGSLIQALQDFYNSLCKQIKLNVSIISLISIVTDIAHKNPRTYQYVAAIISLLLKFESCPLRKNELLIKVVNKFNDIPNTGHLDIWIQRVALGINSDLVFKDPLCKLANGEIFSVWNTSWLPRNLAKEINEHVFVDEDIIAELSDIITYDEVALFKNNYSDYASSYM